MENRSIQPVRRICTGGYPARFALPVWLALFLLTAFSGGYRTWAQLPDTPVHKKGIPLTLQGSLLWKTAALEIDKSMTGLLATLQTSTRHKTAGRVFLHGDVVRKEVALTFDDGPHAKYTPRLLAILKQYHVKATFFLVGQMAERNPQIVKAQVQDGHAIGNHTYHHVNLAKTPDKYVATELKACGEVIKTLTGKAPHLFRPPGGDINTQVAGISGALGYTTVWWTANPRDYGNPGVKVIESRVLAHVANGGIIVLHDGVQQTVEVLPHLLTTLKREGYQFVTIDEMLKHR